MIYIYIIYYTYYYIKYIYTMTTSKEFIPSGGIEFRHFCHSLVMVANEIELGHKLDWCHSRVVRWLGLQALGHNIAPSTWRALVLIRPLATVEREWKGEHSMRILHPMGVMVMIGHGPGQFGCAGHNGVALWGNNLDVASAELTRRGEQGHL